MVKVIPTGGCYLHVQRERMLGVVGGGAADSSRTGWVPNCLDPTPCYFSRDRSATFHVNLTTLGAGRTAPKSLSALAIASSTGHSVLIWLIFGPIRATRRPRSEIQADSQRNAAP